MTKIYVYKIITLSGNNVTEMYVKYICIDVSHVDEKI